MLPEIGFIQGMSVHMIHRTHLLGLAAFALLLPSLPVSATVLINNVTVIDGTGKPAKPGQTVLVDGDRIVAIKDHAVPAPKGATVIDGRGKFLIPGLADMHIHLAGRPKPGESPVTDGGRRLLQGYLYDGVTFVYDAGNDPSYIFAMREAERSGRMISPRIFATGFGIGWTGGYGGAGPGAVQSYEEGVKAFDVLLPQKPDLIKFLYAPLVLNDPKVLPAWDLTIMHRLIMYANERGFRTTIHAVEESTARNAIEAGINTFAHPVYLSDTSDKHALLVATRGIPVVSTLAVMTDIIGVVENPKYFEAPAYRSLLTDADIAYFGEANRDRYIRTNLAPWAKGALVRGSASVRKLYEAGGILVAGTDRSVGENAIQELELMAGAGIPPIQVIKAATLNAAIYLNVQDRIGSIEEGKLADMVLLNADPTKDIQNVRTISAVILGGKVIDRSRLELPVNRLAK